MPTIPLGRSAYQRSDVSPLTLKNRYYEKSPTNLEDQVSLRPRPGLVQFATVGDGPMRGLYRKGNVLANAGHSGAIIARSADNLYRVDQNTGVAVLIDAIEGPGRISAEGDESRIWLAAGTKLYYTDGDTLTHVTMPDDKFAYAVDALGGFYFITSELGRFYWVQPGSTSVDPLDYATAESQPDVLLTHRVIGDELWLFGRYTIEPWQLTGDADLPVQRIGGRLFGIGVTARETVQKFSLQGQDVIAWVGTDRRVYRTSPNPQEISDAGMVERLNRVSDPAAIFATVYSSVGHDFYVLHLTDGLGSWAYDLSTDCWDELTSYGFDNFRADWGSIAPNNAPLLGDSIDGTIWRLSPDARDDNGVPIVFEHSGLLRVVDGPVRCKNVLLNISTGGAPDPMSDAVMSMEISEDRGKTWSDPQNEPLGRQGEYLERVMWSRQGIMRRPGRAFRWRTTEPVTIETAQYNGSWR